MSNKRSLDKIIIVDVESSCWKIATEQPENEISEIIEIGVAVVNLSNLAIEEKDSILVKPTRSRISNFCTQLTTLTQQQVDDGILFAEACQILKSKYKTDRRTWASWGDYDRNMFTKQCADLQIDYPFGPRHLNMKNLFAITHSLTKEVGLDKALNLLSLPFEGTHHRGGDDAYNIARVFIDTISCFRNQ